MKNIRTTSHSLEPALMDFATVDHILIGDDLTGRTYSTPIQEDDYYAVTVGRKNLSCSLDYKQATLEGDSDGPSSELPEPRRR